jgi:hypothetical protein
MALSTRGKVSTQVSSIYYSSQEIIDFSARYVIYSRRAIPCWGRTPRRG